MRSRCGPSEAGGRARALPPRWQLREPGSGAAAGAAAATAERSARRAPRPGPPGWEPRQKLETFLAGKLQSARPSLRASGRPQPGSVAGDGGEEGSRGGSPGNESEAGGKVSGRPRPPSAANNGSFPGIGAGKPGAPGLGLGAAGESVQAVSCAPGGTGCSSAGPGEHRDHAARGLSQPSLLRLLCPLARQGLGCTGHLGWGWGSCVRAGRVAPRGLECRGARVAKLARELQRGAESCCPLWS